jgi:hypothetical protein
LSNSLHFIRRTHVADSHLVHRQLFLGGWPKLVFWHQRWAIR